MCTVDGCKGRHKARGFCNTHYERYRIKGNPLYKRTVADRFWEKVDRTAGDEGCWIWLGARIATGYGQLYVDGRMVGSHRLSYSLNVGELVDGLVIDHICHNPPCVNPAHLQQVSIRYNMENRAGTSTGHRGVYWDKKSGSWRAQVGCRGKNLYLGNYPLYELHVAGYKAMVGRSKVQNNNLEDRKHLKVN